MSGSGRPRARRADRRRSLPSVEKLATEAARLMPANGAAARTLLTELARSRLADRRAATTDKAGSAVSAKTTASTGAAGELHALAEEVAAAARRLLSGTIQPVINATGVILQTNLGRAPLSAAALDRVAAIARGYSTLEYDLERGARGERSGSLAGAFRALLGVPAVVVNNNAASLVLSLFALARGQEVVVSRGELIEIGGSFRLPEVMRISGARLVEVGTTNRTRLADYRDGITTRTAMLLKVHASNFQVVGFTEAVPASDVAGLAQERGLIALEDLGSGSLLPTEAAGLAHEPTVQDALGAGMDLVAFSGDKLLGGPQAGVVAGRSDLVARLGRSPLYRALRPDKLTLAAMEATLSDYLAGAADDLPLWRMLRQTAAGTRARATAWADQVDVGDVIPVESTVGGGSLPGQVISGFGLAVGSPGRRPSASTLAARLRRGTPPVVARVHEGRVLLDPRTVPTDQDADLVAALRAALRG
jgi:L-seryl-tRNA(Ser) seleniumtransferase